MQIKLGWSVFEASIISVSILYHICINTGLSYFVLSEANAVANKDKMASIITYLHFDSTLESAVSRLIVVIAHRPFKILFDISTMTKTKP